MADVLGEAHSGRTGGRQGMLKEELEAAAAGEDVELVAQGRSWPSR